MLCYHRAYESSYFDNAAVSRPDARECTGLSSSFRNDVQFCHPAILSPHGSFRPHAHGAVAAAGGHASAALAIFAEPAAPGFGAIRLHHIAVFESGRHVHWLGHAALQSGRKARKNGATFVLDRACPHVDFQQSIVSKEAEKAGAMTGTAWQPEPEWFHERQLAEYQEADFILVPSEYSRRTFSQELQSKIIKAPLLGRCRFPETVSFERNATFTVGAVGGQALRKGYLYLLQAWKSLALPNAKLLIRGDFTGYPVLAGTCPLTTLGRDRRLCA